MSLPHDFDTLTHARIASEKDSNLDSLPTCTRRHSVRHTLQYSHATYRL